MAESLKFIPAIQTFTPIINTDGSGLNKGYVMGKKLFVGVLLLFLCFSLSAQGGLRIVLEQSADGFTIIRSEGSTRELAIPEAVNDIPIIAIGENAFIRSGLTMVTIPDTVIEIGEGAFSHNDLSVLVIGNNVETIGRRAFSNNRINDLTIGANVTSIGMGAFANNELENLVIPDSVTAIEPYAFFSNRLIHLTIPDGVTTIGEGAFSTNRLLSVVIGNSVEVIGDGAFFNNQLTSITIPDTITALGSRVFESRLTRRGAAAPVDYVTIGGEILYTTANNFDTFFAFTGRRAGTYTFSTRDGWAFEE